MSLSIQEEKAKDITVLKVGGFVDTSTSSSLEDSIKGLHDTKKTKVIIDLAGVEFISSAGWGILVAYLRKMRSAGGDIKLTSMVEKVDNVFKLMEFDSLIDAYPTLDKAVKSFDD